ncbi:MAG: DUF202 domain-containing protein [Vulcanimicrobiaceae bacterium]
MKAYGSATDHLANERTFLAWVRTALAFIGFGFVIARFSVFMREFTQIGGHAAQPAHSLSDIFGVVMVLAGIVVGAFGAYRYCAQLESLRTQGAPYPMSRMAAIATAVMIAVFAGMLALVLGRI